MNTYAYSGPVMEFGRCITNNWKGETRAKTEAKAKSNLIYTFKINNNRLPNSKISLPGKLKVVED